MVKQYGSIKQGLFFCYQSEKYAISCDDCENQAQIWQEIICKQIDMRFLKKVLHSILGGGSFLSCATFRVFGRLSRSSLKPDF